jgi:hypothetical protein
MSRFLLSVMFTLGSFLPVSAEVEYEIHTGFSNADTEGVFREGSSRVLELRTYHAAPGKLDALLTRFRDHTCELFTKHGMTDVGYWVPVENPDNLLIYLMAYPDKQSRDASWKAFMADPGWKNVQADSEVDGKLVAKVDQLFMTPTDFSEGFAKVIPNEPQTGVDQQRPEGRPRPRLGNDHLFEMRTYTTTPGHLPNLKARFRDHTMALFKKHGITNLAYFQFTPDQAGADNTLLYFIAHKDAEAATKSWDAFRADPEWIAAKAASEKEAGGSLTAEGGVKSVFLKPTDFSPVK